MLSVERLHLAWLLALMRVELLATHGLAYRLVYADTGKRSRLLDEKTVIAT